MIESPNKARHRQEEYQRFYDEAPRPAGCPYCGFGRIHWDGSSVRSASIGEDGATVYIPRIPQRRAECVGCGKSWIVRPPGLVAHKHYQLCVVAKAACDYLFEPGATQARVADRHDCSSRTLSRWLRWVGQVASPAAIQARILAVTTETVLAPVLAVANLARKARTALRRAELPAAAKVLCLFESLGVALGLEPPGLRSVIMATLRDRSRIATYARPRIPEFGKVTV